MVDGVRVADEQARRSALDPAGSFIVRAPAGSGKTELLAQRYLTLLARVGNPEEIVAITFTRKAVAEMRSRIVSALQFARGDPQPPSAHERLTWELARAVLRWEQQRGWRIEDNPGRLRIQTIDSLCAALTRQMPVLSRFGAHPAIIEDADELYRRAARNTLAALDSGEPWSAAIETLLAHRDNDLAMVEDLLVRMLVQRGQWLRHVADRKNPRIERATLEAALENCVCDGLQMLRESVPGGAAAEILTLARYAAETLQRIGGDSEIRAWLDRQELPGTQTHDLAAWRGLARLLLAKDGMWRKTATSELGFPAPSGTRDLKEQELRARMKERFRALVQQLAGSEVLLQALQSSRSLPPARYENVQWQVMEALFELLPMAVAELRLVFAALDQVDFAEVSEAAITALGAPDAPTDLALALDYRIQHLLVDEFQDTSVSQFELLTRLTAGWERGDGRTLFLVGDPMQSIYRFRQAEVGLFLRTQRHVQVGGVKLHPLTLRANFRSQQGIVDWVNTTFSNVLPVSESIATGAVPFARSDAVKTRLGGAAVSVYPFYGKDLKAEADRVMALVKAARQEDADGTIAILVRSRTHLAAIVPRLRGENLRFRAIEIDPLSDRPVIQDMLALTRALVHLADRPAWLSILRAPWCGLTLADLHALAGDDHTSTLWELIQDDARGRRLTPDGQKRLLRIREVLRVALTERRRRSLRRWVEGAWLALGGPACVEGETDLENVGAFLSLVDELDDGGDLLDLDSLEEQAKALYAAPDLAANEGLQIMTIHKAKGLEFDTVIVPGLGSVPPAEEPRLLNAMERPRASTDEDLLLAPIKESGMAEDGITAYLRSLDMEKSRWEAGRLLYVAATRAKKRLYLLGYCTASAREGHRLKPARGSLLAELWPAVAQDFVAAQATTEADRLKVLGVSGAVSPGRVRRCIQRLRSDWTLPDPPNSVRWYRAWSLALEADGSHRAVEFTWASGTIRYVGTVVHRILRQIADEGIDLWDNSRITLLRPHWRAMLVGLGVPAAERDEAVVRVEEALIRTLGDARGRWIVGPHREGHSEYALTGVYRGAVVTVVLDRSFVDEHGVRWIIDYKTGVHEGGRLEEFLDREQERYREQLELYGALMAQREARPIRLGLYFPLLSGWRAWNAV
ncbi:MAG: UvrD-helicase domain-containing protein [Gammaproteobacteria bacterium]|nr:UvrD-helicase domain-containing protein [Gammaproteobacteria bacterium]